MRPQFRCRQFPPVDLACLQGGGGGAGIGYDMPLDPIEEDPLRTGGQADRRGW